MPNSGVVQAGRSSFVVADIPGLIEGAHAGTAWAYSFCGTWSARKLLVHLVDVSELSGRDPAHDFEIVLAELESFRPELLEKPMLVVASKIDVAQDPQRIESVRQRGRRSTTCLSSRFPASPAKGSKN